MEHKKKNRNKTIQVAVEKNEYIPRLNNMCNIFAGNTLKDSLIIKNG